MKVTPHLDVLQIVADEFHRNASYKNWRPQGTRDWLFIYTLRGGGRYQGREDGEFRSAEGDCTLYEPGAWQQYAAAPATGEWNLLWAHFQPLPHWRAWMDWSRKWRGLRAFSVSNAAARGKVVSGMRDVVRSCRSGLPLSGDLALNGMERVLLEIETERRGHPLGKLDERIIKAVNYLALRFQEPFSVEKLAGDCGLSPSRLAHLFKIQTGTTPQRMLEENRMRHASQMLLSTGLSVGEIAEEAGYESPFYFTQRFHLFFGKSPRDFRKTEEKTNERRGFSG